MTPVQFITGLSWVVLPIAIAFFIGCAGYKKPDATIGFIALVSLFSGILSAGWLIGRYWIS